MGDEELPEVGGVRGEDEPGEGDAAVPADDQPVQVGPGLPEAVDRGHEAVDGLRVPPPDQLHSF